MVEWNASMGARILSEGRPLGVLSIPFYPDFVLQWSFTRYIGKKE